MYRKSNMETYITIHKIDSQREFSVWLRKLKQGLCINLEGWDAREIQKGGIYVYLWLIHIEVWQKTTKICKAIILQLKKSSLERNKSSELWWLLTDWVAAVSCWLHCCWARRKFSFFFLGLLSKIQSLVHAWDLSFQGFMTSFWVTFSFIHFHTVSSHFYILVNWHIMLSENGLFILYYTVTWVDKFLDCCRTYFIILHKKCCSSVLYVQLRE